MRPPLAGKRDAARRLAVQVRRRLEPLERSVLGRGRGAAEPAAAAAPPPPPPDAAARIDAARERLRASITPPAARDDE